ncbi:MAG TPA: response regulator transcription factor [Paucimonas sp.]|nr:response regulator transcription factor [Paucimonas sp.]
MTPIPADTKVRVVIVEDDDHARSHLGAAIAALPGYALAASFDQMRPAIAWLESNPADILLTDLGLPDGSGIDVIRACAARWPACDIMVITMFGDENNVLSSMEAGATGYILKDGGPFDMGRMMQDLRAGGSPMSPLIARKVLERALQRTPSPAAPPALPFNVTLTKRESDTLNLIARGYTYEETARALSVSLSTIQTHIRGIYGKLAVNSRSEAVFEAHKLGLLQDGLLKP